MKLIYVKLKNFLIFLGFINLLVSCSSTRIVYSLAEEFILNEINYFLNIDKNDNTFLKQQVSEMIEWHRKSMLPMYALYLTDMADKILADQYKADDIKKMIVNGRYLYEETVTGLTPYASAFLIRYQNSRSIEYMEKKMDKRRNKRLKELSESEEILFEKRLDKLISNFERFLGSLTNAQINLLKDHSHLTLYDSKIRLRNRTQRQKLFIDFLGNKPTEQELKVYLDKLLLQDPSITDTDQLTFSEVSLDRFQKLIVGMLSISTSSQREIIIRKLLNYARDFENISG